MLWSMFIFPGNEVGWKVAMMKKWAPRSREPGRQLMCVAGQKMAVCSIEQDPGRDTDACHGRPPLFGQSAEDS